MLDRVHETYDTELGGKDFAYDGEKSLFTIGALPRNKLEFTVVLEEVGSSRYVIIWMSYMPKVGNCAPLPINFGKFVI